MSSGSAQETSGDQRTAAESPTDQTHKNKPQSDQTEQNRHEQERGSQQNRQTGSYQQGGGDGKGEESDSDDEDRDPTYQVSQLFPCMGKSKKKSKKKVKNKDTQCLSLGQDQINDSNINEGSNHEFQNKEIRVGLLNVQSMNKKTSRIKELITGNNRDVFLTTETWLKKKKKETLKKASPEDFSYHYQARGGWEKGGGVAIQFSNEFQGEQMNFDNKKIYDKDKNKYKRKPFEYVATNLKHDEWDQPVQIINLYRRPGNKYPIRPFLGPFETLLKEVSNEEPIIMTGDFNIKVDEKKTEGKGGSCTDDFDELLQRYNLVQHVHEPTHKKDHTLDLVITKNVEISGLSVRNDGISDHYTVYFNARPKSKDTTKETEEDEDPDELAKQFKSREE